MAFGLAIYVLILSLQPNPITLNYKLPFAGEIAKIAPQGWAFFTKDIRHNHVKLYRLDAKKQLQNFRLSSSAKNQLYGLKRDNRAIMHKINYLASNLDDSYWYEYSGNINLIPRDSLKSVPLDLDTPMVYGKYLVSVGNPLPYEWSRSDREVYLNNKYVVLDIQEVLK